MKPENGISIHRIHLREANSRGLLYEKSGTYFSKMYFKYTEVGLNQM